MVGMMIAMRSTGECLARSQILDFFWRIFSTQQGIAVREASEALDQVAVMPGKAQVVFQSGRFEQANGFILVINIFAVHQWHIKESKLLGGQFGIKPVA